MAVIAEFVARSGSSKQRLERKHTETKSGKVYYKDKPLFARFVG